MKIDNFIDFMVTNQIPIWIIDAVLLDNYMLISTESFGVYLKRVSGSFVVSRIRSNVEMWLSLFPVPQIVGYCEQLNEETNEIDQQSKPNELRKKNQNDRNWVDTVEGEIDKIIQKVSIIVTSKMEFSLETSNLIVYLWEGTIKFMEDNGVYLIMSGRTSNSNGAEDAKILEKFLLKNQSDGCEHRIGVDKKEDKCTCKDSRVMRMYGKFISRFIKILTTHFIQTTKKYLSLPAKKRLAGETPEYFAYRSLREFTDELINLLQNSTAISEATFKILIPTIKDLFKVTSVMIYKPKDSKEESRNNKK